MHSLIADSLPQTHEFVVTGSRDRLDRWLAEQGLDLSRARVQKLIEQGMVRLNQQVCQAKNAVVQAGDQIQLTIPLPQPLELVAEDIPLDILYEDEHLIILNKPAGMVVHPSAGHDCGTLVNALLAHCQQLAGIGGVERPGIVHRLDKDTTGALAIAKTDIAHQHLQKQFHDKTARRSYLGIVYGAPKQERGTVDQPIGRHPIDRQKMAIVPEERGGRRAVTHWHVKERLGHYTLINFELETGRTHQIRVHANYLGHPIVGDPVYSSGKSIGVNLPGQALHAWRLTLYHPISEQPITVEAALPPHWLKLLDVLRHRTGSSR